MPVFSFGERKNRRLKSSGLSSSQTLSSFCQTVRTPSLRRASLMTSANGRSPPGATATGGAPGGRRPDAAPPGPERGRGSRGGGAGGADGPRRVDGLERRAAGQHGACGDEQGERPDR